MLFIVGVYVAYGAARQGCGVLPHHRTRLRAGSDPCARRSVGLREGCKIVPQGRGPDRTACAGIQHSLYPHNRHLRAHRAAEMRRGRDRHGYARIHQIGGHAPESGRAILDDDTRSASPIIPGIVVEIRKQQQGPGSGKPIQVELAGRATPNCSSRRSSSLAQGAGAPSSRIASTSRTHAHRRVSSGG